MPVFVKYGRKKIRQNVLMSIGEPIPAEDFDVDYTDKYAIRKVSEEIMGKISELKENAPDVR